ncbi:HTH DNA binding protein [Caulobacter phage CcrRogue]|uniref:Putative winged-helix HTH DNA binding protein n=1 Tax=Caulobacter phage CcrRogue TaxID=2927986 RepID=K4JP47_9CAUD|nr:HTH DNA binding protein [Caulobacter phage CcrRogue]AFU86786.1 putative winged-helix HTH DNA binding protein [Caulobacter phage CcrRogue]
MNILQDLLAQPEHMTDAYASCISMRIGDTLASPKRQDLFDLATTLTSISHAMLAQAPQATRDAIIHDKADMGDPIMAAFRLGQLSMAGEIMGYEATRRADDDIIDVVKANLGVLSDIREGRNTPSELAMQFGMTGKELKVLVRVLEHKGLVVTVTSSTPGVYEARLTPLAHSILDMLKEKAA